MRSMTGFGRAKGFVQGNPLICEVRSLNHRFLEIQMRLPRILERYEGEIRKFLTRKLERGSITLRFHWEERGPEGLKVNWERAKAYLKLLQRLKRDCNLKGEVDLSLFAHLNGIFEEPALGGPKVKGWEVAKRLLDKATSELIKMREREGRDIGRTLNQGIRRIEKSPRWIENRGSLRVEERRKGLKSKLEELLKDEGFTLNASTLQPFNFRIEQEILLFAERCDIEEELSRLKSHTASFQNSINSKRPGGQRVKGVKRLKDFQDSKTRETQKRVGRRLDFLLQEMHREANTLGSKAQDASVSLEVVKIKEELERVREQVQNLE